MKQSTKIFLIAILTTAAVVVFAFVLIHAVWYAPADEIALPSSEKNLSKTVQAFPSPLDPEGLRIPAIGVQAKVQDVGITKSGNMATPNNFTDVGWFKYGTVPGEVGNAVIAGHVDDGLAFPGVFKNLQNLKNGDDIYVDTVGGKTIHFVVLTMTTYDYKAPTEAIFNDTNGSKLTLITCAGVWVPDYHTHNERLVVTAVKVNDDSL